MERNSLEMRGVKITSLIKFFGYSAFGIFAFFIPITFNGKSSIPLDHLVSLIKSSFKDYSNLYALLLILLGALIPFIQKSWNKNKTDMAFSLLKVLGFITALGIYFQIGPEWLFKPSMGPFLYEKLVIPISFIVPVGSIFLAFLVGYGFLEFIGVFMEPIMKPIWKTQGRSAIDAVASFVGSYSIGLLITNRVYKEGKYTTKEAIIIATGFSTVSVTFMILIAKTLNLMDFWNSYFWSTIIITFIVTAISVRIWPIKGIPEEYFKEPIKNRETEQGSYFKKAWTEAMRATLLSPSLGKNIALQLKDGLLMTMGILPSIMSVGLIGLILAEFTPVFDWLGYLFFPFTWLLKIPEPLLAAKASGIGIAEMFLPALLVTKAPLITRFVIAVVSVSSIIFFSATIPCIISTEIPISLSKLLVIWFERVLLTLLLATPLAYFLFS
ncbi:YjiH family protein [Xanthovirga aplysinae]|uniref:YjiH family protein n=1 Tax=Xanthovirga aplysinae TaxID=2529853 RepID=UPI0012BC6D79|nr:YjiH family protein [Xanthovirga aplysinae]MTI33217.1 YjiH family protein [Xanthovirga aplysinae]